MSAVQVARLGVPYVLMHMRGDPTTMQSPANTTYEDVCVDVGRELQAAADKAMAAGIEPWSLILDPGPHYLRLEHVVCSDACAVLGLVASLTTDQVHELRHWYDRLARCLCI